MTDAVRERSKSPAKRAPSRTGGGADEEKLVRWVTIGLPVATALGAAGVGVTLGAATSILVLVAGVLLGVIALFWHSLRVLTGDAPLSQELEELEMESQGASALSSRKKMLLRAIKDLENERSIGKIEPEDYAEIAQTYRAELKGVLRRMDEELAPHRARAEEVARRHLEQAGLEGAVNEDSVRAAKRSGTERRQGPKRRECPMCHASNEIDAKFCKECATSLSPRGGSERVASSKDEPAPNEAELSSSEEASNELGTEA